jgi:hypothetical protein
MALRINLRAKKRRNPRENGKDGQPARLTETPLQSRRGQSGKNRRACESLEPGA